MNPNAKEFQTSTTSQQPNKKMAAPAMPGGKAIEGLRQQITANAIILFPRATAYQKHKAEAFEIAVATATNGTQYRAMLTHIWVGERKIAAEGAVKETVNAALCSLLEVTAALMETHAVLGIRQRDKGELRGGAVDASLLG